MNENRIVLIRGNNSEWYEQAIFILKNPVAAKSKNLVLEAEKIINEYMTSGCAGLLPPKLEHYKKAVLERAAASKSARNGSEQHAPAAGQPPAQTIAPQKSNSGKRYDFVSIFIGVCLVISSILFGFVMREILLP